jgi:hypothetical protein
MSDSPPRFFSFTPDAERKIRITRDPATNLRQIHTLYVAKVDKVRAFINNWATELKPYSDQPDITPQLLTALSIAATGADPSYERYHPWLERDLLEARIHPQWIKGEKRTVFSAVGMFAIPVPVARELAKDPELTAEQIKLPATSFELTALWIAHFIAAYSSSHGGSAPSPLHIALFTHFTYGKSTRGNPWGVHFRGNFLPDFAGSFNAWIEAVK